MGNRCYKCSTLLTHHFSDCVSVSCSCSCVSEIYSMPVNEQSDDAQLTHPKFLQLDDAEIKVLPSIDKEIRRFNLINHDEWIKTKKDRRFKSLRKR